MTAVLHVISDRLRNRRPIEDVLAASLQGGADCVQIREKRAPASDTLALALDLLHIIAEFSLKGQVLVNDRLDVAMAADIHGVHLAAKSLPVAVAHDLRRRFSWPGVIGCSVHGLDEAMDAQRAGADYVTFGHVFPSLSHTDREPQGLAALRRVVENLSIPVIAIGGIDSSNVGSVLETRCSGVAVIGAVIEADNPLQATRDLKYVMSKSSCEPRLSFPNLRD